jgi:CheY-like chemotaxis protein
MEEKMILLVEDNPDDVELTLRALEKNGILNKIEVINDGERALNYLFAEGEFEGRGASLKPAVILLDINLPKVDGMEVLKSLRADERTKLIPVVILTSSKEEQDLINGYSLGCNSYVRKPVNFKEFTEAVRQLGLYWLLVNEPAPS